ncbi:MAG: hypothetical protein ACWGSD_13000 [Thermodesulfobacteriota bacterium]
MSEKSVKKENAQQGWHRIYDETPLYTREQVEKALRDFLIYAGYEITPAEPIGFMKPDLVASRTHEKKRYEFIFVIREGINQALEGLRELAAAKCFRKDTLDYVLALPPVSEHYLIEFLIEKEDWFFPIKDHLLQLWLVNPKRETVDCLLGWPRDNDFKHYFSNPNLAGFATYISNKATDKIMKEEFD